VHDGEVVPGRLLEARGDGTEALKVMEEHLNAVAESVSAAIQARLLLTRWIRADYRFDLELLQLGADGVRVVASIGYERFASRVLSDDRFRDG